MAEKHIIPKTRLDLADILKANSSDISQAAREIVKTLGLEEDMFRNVYAQLRKVNEQLKKARKSIDSLEGDWWHKPIPWTPAEENTIDVSSSKQPSSKRRKSLDDITSRKQLLRRTDELYNSLCQIADCENISPHRLLGLLLTRGRTNRKVAEIGYSLWNDNLEESTQMIPEDVALTMYVDANLAKQTYTKMRKQFKAVNCDVMPPWYKLRTMQENLTPQLFPLLQPHVGLYFPLFSAIKFTTKRILDCLPVTSNPDYLLTIKFGFDGSGGHSIFHQAGNVNTNNMILAMFCPLRLTALDGTIVWEVNRPNSPTSQRAIFLQLGKESYESLQSLEVFNDDILKLKKEGIQLIVNDKVMNIKVEIIGYMMDRKAANAYLGLQGSYCDLCSFSKQQCHLPEIIEDGFYIDRNIESIRAIFDELSDEQGVVARKRDDYVSRAGVTQRPIASTDVTSFQVLHGLLRTFDFVMKLIYHLRAEVLDWKEGASNIYLRFLKEAKSEIQESILTKTGIKLDFPDSSGHGGTTTTGNVARRVLFQENIRKIVLEHIHSDLERIREYLSRI